MTRSAAICQAYPNDRPKDVSRHELRLIEGGKASVRPNEPFGKAFVLFVVVVSLVSLGLTWYGIDQRAAARRYQIAHASEVTLVTVCPGDSLWQIAEEHPVVGYTTAELVQGIRSSNDLSTAELHAGMQLIVPVHI